MFIEPIQHLFLAEKVVVQFLVQVFGIFTSTDKVVGLGQFENVDVRHSLQVLSLYCDRTLFVFLKSRQSSKKQTIFTPTGNRTRVTPLRRVAPLLRMEAENFTIKL